MKNGEFDSEHSSSLSSITCESSSSGDECKFSPMKRDFLIMNGHPKKDLNRKRKHFHTKYLINNKVCIIIIDGGCCTNVASQMMV